MSRLATENRFSEYPVIGIRPIIDPRRQVYRSTYDQTKTMADNVARLLSDNLYYPDGSPVKCVVHSKCISNIAEAQECKSFFDASNVQALISVASGWCYPMETMEIDPRIPHAIWGFNGTERPGAVFLAALAAACNLKGLPVFKIYGEHVQDKTDNTIPQDVVEKLLLFAQCAVAVGIMRNKTYLSLGTVSMGIAGCVMDELFFQQYLGMRVSYVDMSEIHRRIQKCIFDPEEFERGMAWVRDFCVEGTDYNKAEIRHDDTQKRKDWEDCVKMAIIVKDMMVGNERLKDLGFDEEAAGHGAIACGFQGQRAWTDQNVNGDFMESVLNSNFDWDGIRPPYIVATENDNMNAVSMLFGYLLTNTPQMFCDIRTYWSPESVKRVTGYSLQGLTENGVIHLLNSGSSALEGSGSMMDSAGNPNIKPFWEMTDGDVKACLDNTRWCPAMLDQFFGGGFSSSYSAQGGMPTTMVRLNMVYGIGPVLQLAEGYTAALPEEVHKTLLNRTDPSWPSIWFVPNLSPDVLAFRDVYSVMEKWGANHASLCYGHIGASLITLASMLRIPINMHNVPAKRVFRPTLWNAYGTRDSEAIDQLVCKNLGPLYK